jgi:hypothetical protein
MTHGSQTSFETLRQGSKRLVFGWCEGLGFRVFGWCEGLGFRVFGWCEGLGFRVFGWYIPEPESKPGSQFHLHMELESKLECMFLEKKKKKVTGNWGFN